ncbi:MAG: hypothetical protein ACFFG0_39735 [Candidatus Thorarchaeota archaeon]
MTVSKKTIIPKIKDDEEIVMDDLSNLKINTIPIKKSGKSIIKISTYSYGSNGLQWHYMSKMNKKT